MIKLKEILLENNAPLQLKLYHGTKKKFDKLQQNNNQHPSHILPFGIHLTDDINVAKRYGSIILTVMVTYRKLYDATSEPDELAIQIAGRRYRKGMNAAECLDAGGQGAWNTTHAENMLERYGYDGVKYKDNYSDANNYVAFYENQVKII